MFIVRLFKIFLLIAVFALNGCSIFSQEGFVPKILYIKLPEPNRIEFQGKGAGAGIALMSSMGPMGIAIGAAIDEGIAKDIREAAAQAGFNIQSSIETSVTEVLGDSYQLSFEQDQALYPRVEIKRYGFDSSGGGAEDLTHAKLRLVFMPSANESETLNYPADLNSEGEMKVPLSVLKKDGHQTLLLMENALGQSFKNLLGK